MAGSVTRTTLLTPSEATTRVRVTVHVPVQTRDRNGRSLGSVRGYDQRSYGDGFADVYDDWYADVTDVAATVARMVEIAGEGARVLELGVGTGRLAVPMAEAGLRVVGVDSSEAMLAKLAERDIHGRVESVRADMADMADMADIAGGLPAGPFDAVLIAYNTIFNLIGDGEQQRLFQHVAARLEPNGAFLVEAFVPDFAPGDGTSEVGVRSMAVDHVVLSVSVNRPAEQLAEGQFVQFSESGGVRLRPWSIRWATPAQLDAMAAAAGLQLDERMADMSGAPFTDDSTQHVSIYRRTESR
jgi:SAM-dependent methyltransferase